MLRRSWVGFGKLEASLGVRSSFPNQNVHSSKDVDVQFPLRRKTLSVVSEVARKMMNRFLLCYLEP